MVGKTSRSLQLTTEQQANANTALSKFGSKADLAAALGMSRTTINNFFKGEPVQRKQFHAICKKLKLDWQPESSPSQNDVLDIDQLVREMRSHIQPLIQQRCGTMRVLDMTQPIDLDKIYTHVNILEKITGRNRRELAELLPEVSPEKFERFSLGDIREKRVPGLEAVEKHSKLMILGKPGAGKTTFLKHLAMQCIGGKFQAHRVPIFITLKDFAEAAGTPDFLTYINSLPIGSTKV
ncbi:MAG: NTPase (NACHT family), partial [Coleofasciculaceae cyanobacterium]